MAINQDAPEYMRAAAKQGLKYYAEGLAGDGLVARTVTEARLMAEGKVSDDKWIRIAAWIARHLPDLDSPNADPDSENYPSAGVVAHLLWGSGPSKDAAQRALSYAQSVVERIRADETRKAGGEQIIICDIDGTLLNDEERLIAKTWDYVQSLEGSLFIVTGRLDSDRDQTADALAAAGITYSRLIMKSDAETDSADYKKATAEELLQTYDVVAAIENDRDALRAYSSLGIEAINPADLPESENMSEERAAIDELAIGDWVSWNALDPEIAAVVTEVDGDQAVLALYDFEDGIFVPTELVMPINVFKLEKIQRPEMLAEKLPEMHDQVEDAPESDPHSDIKAKAAEIIAKIEAMDESEPMTEPVIEAQRDKWLSAAWKIKARLEGSEGRSIGGVETRANHVELRAEGDGRTFTGYAAVFGQPSLPLPFTEIVKPGAFKRSLQSRNRMMLLWNHDTSNPLASTRNGSLQMVEDERGLKVTATLPDTTLGRDIAELVRTGVVDAMSFGFSVKKDSWSQDGQTRYLEDVSLYEVSLVSTPAYEQTSGTVAVRSTDGISADALADALLKIESGEELDAEQGALMQDVISRLSAGKIEETDGDVMALYKKKLALAEMGA